MSDPSDVGVPRRVWHGTLWQVGGRLAASAATAVALLVLSRALPGAEFGRLTFYLALFLLVDAWTDLGSATAIVQRTAHDERALPAALGAGRRLRAVTATIGLLAVLVLALALREPGAGWIVAAALYPLSRVAELSAVVYQSAIRWRVPVATRTLAALLRLAFVLLLVRAGVRQAAVFVFAHALGLALGNLALYAAARPALARLVAAAGAAGGGLRRTLPVRALLPVAWPLGLTAVLQQAYFYADNLFVRGWLGTETLGHYNAAVRVTSLLTMAGTFATTTALPWLTRSWREGRLGAALSGLAGRLLPWAGLLLGALVPWSERLLALCFGAPFAAGGASLRWLLVGALVVHAGGLVYTALFAAGASRSVLVIAALGLALNLAGNAWLVPRLGAEGAAIATLATEAWIGVAALVALRRRGWLAGLRLAPWLAGAALFAGAWWSSGLVLGFVR